MTRNVRVMSVLAVRSEQRSFSNMKCFTRSRSSAARRYAEKDKVEQRELKGHSTQPKKCPSTTEKATRCPAISHHSDTPKGSNNKENYQKKVYSPEVATKDEVILGNSSLADDSGYLSFLNSQLDHADVESSPSQTYERCPEERESRLFQETTSESVACLPMLQFQKDVCKELSKCYKKSQSCDWTVINQLAEDYGLHNVIGGKMGLDCVDILCDLLRKDMKHILSRILELLGESDLINCQKVSKTWMKIICQDKKALQRCRREEASLRDSRRSTGSLSRDFGLNRVVFSCLQSVASSTPVHKPPKKTVSRTDSTKAISTRSRFQEFYEATRSLKRHEALRSCRLCGSPARFDPAMQRAVCMRQSCAFDFCSQCQSAYHDSVPCQRGIIKNVSCSERPIVVGSAHSKRNVRRL